MHDLAPIRPADAPIATTRDDRLHVAIIMDGNGRWAQRRSLPRVAGHRQGGKTVRRVIEAAPGLGISTLTLYAFSADNWKRPAGEVSALMRLFRAYLADELERCVESGVRFSVIGRRDRLQPDLVAAIERMERATARGTRIHVRLAVDYSSRAALLRTMREVPRDRILTAGEFSAALNESMHSPTVPDVDLLIRTSGEQRLSDFMLWECAYAELWFTKACWPEFSAADLRRAIADYTARNRTFGAIPRVEDGTR